MEVDGSLESAPQDDPVDELFNEGEEGEAEDDDDDDDDVEIMIGPVRTNVPFVAGGGAKQGAGASGGPATGGKQLDLDATPEVNGVGVYDLDIAGLEEKPWRQPGADITDYFNYGFNEETWNIYCERQRKLMQEYGSRAVTNKVLFSNITLTNLTGTTPSSFASTQVISTMQQGIPIIGTAQEKQGIANQVQQQQPVIRVNLAEKYLQQQQQATMHAMPPPSAMGPASIPTIGASSETVSGIPQLMHPPSQLVDSAEDHEFDATLEERERQESSIVKVEEGPTPPPGVAPGEQKQEPIAEPPPPQNIPTLGVPPSSLPNFPATVPGPTFMTVPPPAPGFIAGPPPGMVAMMPPGVQAGPMMPPGVSGPPPGYRYPPPGMRPPPQRFHGFPPRPPPMFGRDRDASPASYSDKSSDEDQKPSYGRPVPMMRGRGRGGMRPPPVEYRGARKSSPPQESPTRKKRTEERSRLSSKRRERSRSRSHTPTRRRESRRVKAEPADEESPRKRRSTRNRKDEDKDSPDKDKDSSSSRRKRPRVKEELQSDEEKSQK